MKKPISLIVLILIVFTGCIHNNTPSSPDNSKTWKYLGSAGFSQSYNILDVYLGTPYISCLYDTIDPGTGNPIVNAYVQKFENGAWTDVGNRGFKQGSNFYGMKVVGGIIYAVFKDEVMKYEAGVWSTQGPGPDTVIPTVAPPATMNMWFGITKWPNIYEYCIDDSYYSASAIIKYDGVNWTNIGTPYTPAVLLTDHVSIRMAEENGILYTVYNDIITHTAYVSKYEGGIWTQICSLDITNSYVESFCVYNSTPFVSLNENQSKLSVLGYSSGTWYKLLDKKTFNHLYFSLLSIDNGKLYCFYSGDSDKFSAMKYIGTSWVDIGQKDFSDRIGETTISAAVYDDVPYVFYGDVDAGLNNSIMRYE